MEAAMRALVYHGPGRKAWEEVPDPEITDEGDSAVLKVVLTRGEGGEDR
jgi:threonine dehydrogenase-like Zn-dependent dehydrogenase